MAKVYSEYSKDSPNHDKIVGHLSPKTLKARFLELFCLTAHVHKTCTILGIVPRTVYHWKKNDPEFAEEYEVAEAVALTALEDEAVRRSLYGIDEPVFYKGEQVGYIRRYSDTLLIILLKARAPHKYKERFAGELTGADGKPLNMEARVVHVHSNLPLATSEDQVLLDNPRSNTEDVEPVSIQTSDKTAEEQRIEDENLDEL